MIFDKPILLTEALQRETILREEFSVESFMSWATRKLKGYSVKEIDNLARRVVHVSSHEEKTDLIERIRESERSAKKSLDETREKLSKDPKDVKLKEREEYLKDHIQVLSTLEGKVKTFNVIDHHEKRKDKDESDKEDERKSKIYRIDDET